MDGEGPALSARNDGVDKEGLSGPAIGPPSLTGRHVHLRPVFPEDHPLLFALAINDQVGYRWRYRGAVPSYEHFVQAINSDVLVQFAVSPCNAVELLGLVVVYSADLRNGYAYVAAAMVPSLHGSGLGVEATILLMRYAFTTWNLRKLYLEAPEYAMQMYGSGIGKLFEVEGRLRQHVYYGGRFWDTLLLASYPHQVDRYSI